MRSLYNSYIRAIRWASDRIGSTGIIGFVTNAGFLDAISSDGMRRCLADEFSNIYVFHLRGNQRTVGELSRKEGGKVFGGGSRAPIAISILVKNAATKAVGQVHFHDVGDYLSREEKLQRVIEFGSIAGIAAADGWRLIAPDSHGDWLRQRTAGFSEYVVLGDKKSAGLKLFDGYSNGVKTNRDTWVFNYSRSKLEQQLAQSASFFNEEVARYTALHDDAKSDDVDSFIRVDRTRISWADDFKNYLRRGRTLTVRSASMAASLYRPYTKQWLCYDKEFVWSLYHMRRIFPSARADNRAIMVKLRWPGHGQLALMVDCVPEQQTDGGSQCFPLYLYDVREPAGALAEVEQSGLFDDTGVSKSPSATNRRDAITAEGLAHFQSAYPDQAISREDIFYYVYGLLHSSDYLERFADNLGKELPRIPRVKSAADFWAFSQAGRKLAELHLNYESVEPYPLKIDSGGRKLTDIDYRVEKMRYGKKGKDKDLTTLHYNDRITLTGIPLEAYDYVVNGKPALDWVVERQGVKTDKDSGIVNDANDWAIEAMGNPRYPMELFQRVVTVSLETMKIVRALPKLDIASIAN